MLNSFEGVAKNLPNEVKLICALIKSENYNNSDLLIIKELTAPGFDWDCFVQLINHHRVYPIIYERLAKLKAVNIPIDVMKSLKDKYKRNILLMMQLTAEMHTINESFNRHDIRIIMLKGPVISQELFGTISSRTSKDLDIFIPVQDIERAEILLLESGYSATNNNYRIGSGWKWREHHISYFNKRKNIQVELHWRLSPDTDKEPSFDELWECRATSYLLGKPVYLLDNENLFMFLVWHGSRHGWFRLRWLVDIMKLLEKTMDWPKLMSLLSKYHCNHYASQATILSLYLFESSIPSELNSIHKEKYTRFILDVFGFIANIKTNSLLEAGYRRQLFALKTRKQKVVYLFSRLYPNSWDSAAIPLPRQFQFLYFFLRPFILIWRHLKPR